MLGNVNYFVGIFGLLVWNFTDMVCQSEKIFLFITILNILNCKCFNVWSADDFRFDCLEILSVQMYVNLAVSLESNLVGQK